MAALPVLTTTGRPELSEIETNIRRALDGMHQTVNGLNASSIAYTATAADWVAPAPTNLADAITRLAASAGVHPVP